MTSGVGMFGSLSSCSPAGEFKYRFFSKGTALHRLVRLGSPVDAEFIEENPWARVVTRFAEDEFMRDRLLTSLLAILRQVVGKVSADRKGL